MVTRRGRRGANAIELALVAPWLLALVTATMDYGYLFALRFAAITAAEVGARDGALTGQDDGPDEVASASALTRWRGFGLGTDPAVVAFRSGSGPELMVVRLQVDTQPLIGFVPGVTSFEVTRARRMEEQP